MPGTIAQERPTVSVGSTIKTLVVVLASVIVAASCSSAASPSPDAATAGPAVSGSEDELVEGATTIVPPTTIFRSADEDDDEIETIVDLEAEWASARTRAVAALSVAPNGIDEQNVLTGPGGFDFDLDGCPTGWNDAAGVDDATIRLAMVAAQTGDQQDFNDLAVGMQAYFDYVNEAGGIEGRRIELEVRDDGYDPGLAADAVADLIAGGGDTAGQPFSVTTVGTPGSLATYGDLNAACIPQPFVVSAHPAFGDPVAHPFSTGFQLSQATEALLWGTWIKDNLAAMVPVSVGALVIDNDFGQVYADAFQAWADSNRDIVSEVTVVRHEPAALAVADEVAELAALDPEVFLSMTAGQPCLSAIEEAARTGLTDSAAALFTPSGCRQPAAYVAPAGDASQGLWVVGGGAKSINDPAFIEETFVAFAREQLAKEGLDPGRELIGVGFTQYGWAHVEMLRIASALPGGLTRSNLLLALRGADLSHPMLLDGVSFATEGDRDAFFVEGGEYSRYDAGSGQWFQQGVVVDLNGSTPSCSWVRLACRR